jgi:centrosomal protein CEP290
MSEHQAEKNELNEKINNLTHEIDDHRKEIEVLTDEYEMQRQANERAPTTTMKNMVDRLKNQLALKEKQHKVFATYGNLVTWS